MKRTFAVLALLSVFLALPAFAQDALVVELSKDDAAQAAKLYQAKVAADKAWDELDTAMRTKHPEFSVMGGFTFSKDFRFLVVKQQSVPTSGITSGMLTINGTGCPNYYWTPGQWTAPASIPGFQFGSEGTPSGLPLTNIHTIN